MSVPSPTQAARAGDDVFALVRVQGRTVAIPSRHVRQAVEVQCPLTPLPRRAGAIAGVMPLGERVLPVVDLARWLTPEAPPPAVERPPGGHGLVLILHEGARIVGLAIEAVVGAQRVRAAQVRRLFHDDDPEELFQGAALLDGDPVPVNILEPQRLMALAGVWAADADLQVPGDAATAATVCAEPPVDTVPHAVFRIADAHVAVPAGQVGELLRQPLLRTDLPARDGVRGLCEWRDRLVPVVDLTGVLHAMPADHAAAWVCIVCVEDLAIGLLVHEVLALTRIAPAVDETVLSEAGDVAVVAQRLVTGERTLQVVDVAALLRRWTAAEISRKNARAARLRTTADPTAPAYMVFEAGGMFAARIDGVQEVVPVPAPLRSRLDAGLSSTLEWRGQAVPVLPIGDDLVALPARSAHQLVIVRREDQLAALAITGVKALVPRGVALRNRMRVHGRAVEVISVETEDHHASYTVVALGGTAAAVA